MQLIPHTHLFVSFVLLPRKVTKQLKQDVHKGNSVCQQWATSYKRCKLIVVSRIFRANNKETVRPTWMQNKGSCFDKTRKRSDTETKVSISANTNANVKLSFFIAHLCFYSVQLTFKKSCACIQLHIFPMADERFRQERFRARLN